MLQWNIAEQNTLCTVCQNDALFFCLQLRHVHSILFIISAKVASFDPPSRFARLKSLLHSRLQLTMMMQILCFNTDTTLLLICIGGLLLLRVTALLKNLMMI